VNDALDNADVNDIPSTLTSPDHKTSISKFGLDSTNLTLKGLKWD